jgi:surface antigen
MRVSFNGGDGAPSSSYSKSTYSRLPVTPSAMAASSRSPDVESKRGQDKVQASIEPDSDSLRRFLGLDRDRDASVVPVDGAQLAAEANPRIVRGRRKLQCVPFARDASGIAIFGNANRWWELAKGKYPRAKRPEVGSVMVMNGYRTTRRGHVAYVHKILNSRTIIIDHANWLNDGRIYLSAPVRDVSPDNDWSQINVWYTPGRQWGARKYSAKGFIRPSTQVASIR